MQAEKIDEPGCPAGRVSQLAVYGATNVLTIQGETRPPMRTDSDETVKGSSLYVRRLLARDR